MANIVFYGDSITDAGRDKTANTQLGVGYPTIVSGRLSVEAPEKDVFVNKGVSGNRIVDLYAQINGVLNAKPDVISILIGVNDVWHKFAYQNGVATDKFEKVYSLLLDEIYEAYPNVKIMLFEPFVLKGTATEEMYDEFRADVVDKAKAVKRVAEKFNIPFIPLQEKFDSLYNPENPTYWLRDGVHPTHAGHTLIADAWLETYNKYFKEEM